MNWWVRIFVKDAIFIVKIVAFLFLFTFFIVIKPKVNKSEYKDQIKT